MLGERVELQQTALSIPTSYLGSEYDRQADFRRPFIRALFAAERGVIGVIGRASEMMPGFMRQRKGQTFGADIPMPPEPAIEPHAAAVLVRNACAFISLVSQSKS